MHFCEKISKKVMEDVKYQFGIMTQADTVATSQELICIKINGVPTDKTEAVKDYVCTTYNAKEVHINE